MDSTPMAVTSLAVIVFVMIIVVMFACHYLGPRTTTWIRSNKEEKIGLSKNKLFNANGYMIHSGSDFLLSSSGSFKRFDTIDRDYKQTGQNTLHTSPLWNLPQADDIPPQPLRPAPAPIPPGGGRTVAFIFATQEATSSSSAHSSLEGHFITTTMNGFADKQVTSSSGTPTGIMKKNAHRSEPSIVAPPPPRLSSSSSLLSTAIPRPVAKRQHSLQNGCTVDATFVSSAGRGVADKTINLSNAVSKILNSSVCNTSGLTSLEPSTEIAQTPPKTSSTNPFLNEPLEELLEDASLIRDEIKPAEHSLTTQKSLIFRASLNKNGNNNPFAESSEENYCVRQPNETICTPVEDVDLMKIEDDTDSGGDSGGDLSLPNIFASTQYDNMQNGQNTTDLNGIYFDSPCSRVIEDSATSANLAANSENSLLRHFQFRNRSFSETEATEADLKNFSKTVAASGIFKFAGNTAGTNPFAVFSKTNGMHKTFSEDILFRNSATNASNGNGVNHTWSFGRSFLRQDSGYSIGRRNSSQSSLDSSDGKGSMDSINLQRALSCDSVNSESSVLLSDLEQLSTQVTGQLCVGLQYDKNSITNDGMDLIVTVMEANELICPTDVESVDTFVRIYLVPDQAGALQTKLFKNSLSPSYNETFCFWLNKRQGRHSLWFHLYHSGKAHTLIGEAELEIGEIPRPITTWISLSDSRKCSAKWGELMFSLSYLPTAERLTVVVVKAKNLKLDVRLTKSNPSLEMQSIFVKAYLLKDDKKVLKKKTSMKRKDRCPIFNESMIFSVPPYNLTTVQVRLTVFGMVNTTIIPLGHVIVGGATTGKGLRHWHQMLSSLRKPVAMWHVLRRATNQPIFTGGAAAVVAAMESTKHRTRSSIS